MKALLISLSLISFASVANAGLVGDFPKVQFGSTFVSVEDICVNGENVQTLNEVTVCAERAHTRNGYCAKEVTKILSTPRHFTTEIPGVHNRMQTVEVTIPLVFNIGYGYEGKNGIRVVKHENYTLPVCE